MLKGARDADERHATLRATIAWSHDLLAEDEQRLFRRLAIFRGGCTIGSAEAVCASDLETLASLLDKSLVRRRADTLGEDRFWMLETIREFAAEHLEQSGEATDVGRRHALHMLELARSAHLTEDDFPADMNAALAERDNFRAALDWAEERDPTLALELAVELQQFWNAASPDEGRQRLERLFNRAPPISTELRAHALRVYGGTVDLSGQFDDAERLWEESLALYRELGDDRGVAGVQHMLAVSAWRREDWARMRELTEQSLAIAEGRFPFIETTGRYLLGEIARLDGDLERATELTWESARLAHDAGWVWWESGQMHALLMLALEEGDLDEAEQSGVAALRLEREHENRLWALYTIAGLGQVAHAAGDLTRAGILWGAAEREAGRLPRWSDERARRGGVLVMETDSAFAAAVERGSRLELWDAVAFALREDDGPSDRPVEREHDADELLRVVVEPALTNRPRALVPAGERKPHVARRTRPTASADSARRPARSRGSRAGSSLRAALCRRTPTSPGAAASHRFAPTLETTSCWNPDSIQASARARLGSTP